MRREPVGPDRDASARSVSRPSPDPVLGRPSGELQRFGTVRAMPAGLNERARRKSCDLLNGILADSLILYALYKKHHWLVAGPTFYPLHLLFDKHAEEQEALIDQLAERVQVLGGIAVGDPRHAAELTGIERAPDGAEDVPDMIARTLRGHESVMGRVREAIEATEESKDWGTNDLLMGDVLRTNEMQVWFLSAHLVEMPLVAG
jgi:starvation-inducible DNA-binding protein